LSSTLPLFEPAYRDRLTAEKKDSTQWSSHSSTSRAWAVSIHTVTFLYARLPGRGLADGCAALLPNFAAAPRAILLALLVRIDSTRARSRSTLAKIVAYALPLNIFLLGCEIFTVFYSNIPDHKLHFQYLYGGLHGHDALVPWMWGSLALAVTAIVLLVNPGTRRNEKVLAWACVMTFTATWIDKGLGMISGGFVPNPLEEITSTGRLARR
jgi:molybdopterin-containing oxidoreductase family membrane subunit